VSPYVQGNEPSISINCWAFLEDLSIGGLRKKDFAPFSQSVSSCDFSQSSLAKDGSGFDPWHRKTACRVPEMMLFCSGG
jgi:hypothetical protein